MSVWMPPCGLVHGTVEAATDVELVAPAEVADFVAAHGGRLFVWVSAHPGFPSTVCLLEASLEPPKGDVGFRRIPAPGFDVYLESTQKLWPRTIELALKRRRRVEAYWNGVAWIV